MFLFGQLGDASLEIDASGLTSYQYGIGVYTPSIEVDLEIESLIVFKEDYYSEEKMNEIREKVLKSTTLNNQ